MNTNGRETGKDPTRFQQTLRVACIVVSSPVIWLGLTGLFLVSGSLILNDSRDRQDFWFAHLCVAVLSVLLICAGYGIGSSARRARSASGLAQSAAADPGSQTESLRRSQIAAVESQTTFFDRLFGLFKRRKFGPLSASLVGILVVVALIAYLAIKAISIPRGSLPRELISEGLYAGVSLRDKVTEFHQEHRRLPQPSEAAAFRIAPSELRSTRSVAWDPAGRMIVITAGEPQPGKRFAFHAEVRDGALTWTCRSIDLDVKYLPGSCR